MPMAPTVSASSGAVVPINASCFIAAVEAQISVTRAPNNWKLLRCSAKRRELARQRYLAGRILRKESLRRHGRKRQPVLVLSTVWIVTVTERVDAHPTKIKRAVNDVAADNVALVNEHLCAQVSGHPRSRADRDQGI